MTLLMVTLSPYHGPEVRVHFVCHQNFQFFAKSFPLITCKMKIQNPGPFLLFYKGKIYVCSINL